LSLCLSFLAGRPNVQKAKLKAGHCGRLLARKKW
jgi:hypothetical protein